jgi:Ohr subfamily peroxiredoxin
MEELQQRLYTTSATAQGGRRGHVRSTDGIVDFDLGAPGAPGPAKANPETLFAAGYAACFQNALLNRARAAGADASDSVVMAAVSLGKTSEEQFGIAVEITVDWPGMDRDKAQGLVDLAHTFCPYSKATRGNIPVTVTLV